MAGVPVNMMQKCLQYYYNNGNHNNHFMPLPQKLFRELEKNTLILSEHDIVPEEIALLCKFMANKTICDNVEKIMLVKCTANTVRSSLVKKSNVKEHAPVSMNRLFRHAVELIAQSRKLHTVVIDNVSVELDLLEPLGRSMRSCISNIRWFQFSHCDIGGDEGFKIITPHLMRTPSIQVLILEKCELTDASTQQLTGIIKAQEAAMDTLFWNVTLRIQPPNALEKAKAAQPPPPRPQGPWRKHVKSKFHHRLTTINMDHATFLEEDVFRASGSCSVAESCDESVSADSEGEQSCLSEGGCSRNQNDGAWDSWIPKDDENIQREVNAMYSGGLVAMSVNGNHFSAEGMEQVFRNLKHNHWLLGLNMANNDISEDCIKNSLVSSLMANNVLHTVVFAGNPGYSAALASKLKHFTDNCECRFDVLEPEALQSLLYRWSLMQDHEAHGAGVSVTVKHVTTHADLTSTSAWKDGRPGASVDTTNPLAVCDRRTYADEPRPRWTCNAKGLKPPTVIVGGKYSSKPKPGTASSVTHEELLAASLKREDAKGKGKGGSPGREKGKGRRSASLDSTDLDDDYWRCRSFAESSIASSLEAEGDSGGARGSGRYQSHYDHYRVRVSADGGGEGEFNLHEVLEEIEQQQQDARDDVLAGALPSGPGTFVQGHGSPSQWADGEMFSPTRMRAADAMLDLKGAQERPVSRGSIRNRQESPQPPTVGQFIEGATGRAVTSVGRMRERPSSSPPRPPRAFESPRRARGVGPKRSMSAPLSVVNGTRQSVPATSATKPGSRPLSSSSVPAPVSKTSGGVKSMSVGFGRHSSEAPLLQRSRQVQQSSTGEGVAGKTKSKTKSKTKTRRAAGTNNGSVSAEILGGDKQTRMRVRVRQQDSRARAGRGASVPVSWSDGGDNTNKNPYLSANPLLASPVPTRASVRSPSPNIVGASIKVSPALSAVSGLTASTTGSRSASGASAASSSRGSTKKKAKKGSGKGKKKVKGTEVAQSAGVDIIMSPATKALERKLGNAVAMLTNHVATVSRQLHVATDRISEQVQQGVEAINRSAEKAQSAGSSQNGSPFSLLQSSVNSNGSPAGASVGSQSKSKADSKPNVFANLTEEEESEVRSLIQASLQERIAAIYRGAK